MAKKRKLEHKSQIPPTNTAIKQDEEPVEEEEEVEQTLDAEHESQDSAPATQGGENEGHTEEEPVQNLLEPFTKEQLIDLLNEASNTHSDVLDRIKTLADVDPVHRKIFVHGLGWDTTAETLTNVFSKYGEIEDCKAVCDKISGKSKGYAFIMFKHRSGARKALKEPQKRIGSRMTACQLASAGPVTHPVPSGPPVSEYTQRKIFVSNVSADIDPHKLLSFFSKYGEIVEGPLGLDKETGKPKGFTLFVYKTIESVKKALEEPHKSFEGHILHCQKAVDGPKIGKMNYQSSSLNYARSGNTSVVGDMGSHDMNAGGQGMVSPAGVAFNQSPAAATPQLNPVLGQALTALLASQGGGLGLTNLLGQLGSSGGVSPSVPPVVNNLTHGMQGGYGNQSLGSNIGSGLYANQAMGSSSGLPNYQMGHTNTGRSQQGAGHMGGAKPYMGH